MTPIAATATNATAWLAPLVTVLGVLALGFILMLSLRDRIARRSPSRTAREQIDAVKGRSRPVRDGNAASAELYDTAQRLASQLDNKAERLEQLIAAADERLARLERAGGAPTSATAAPESAAGSRSADAVSTSISPGSVKAPSTDSTDALRGSIYELADRGLDPIAIAQHLDEQVGKIELVLALRAERLATER